MRQSHEGNLTQRKPWERHGSIDVEALAAWAYGVQMVDRFERVGLHAIEADAMGLEPRGYSADGCGMLMAIDNLGCRVDSGGAVVNDVVHPVAYAVATAVAAIGEAGSLVRQYALAGTRPETWRAPEHKVRPRVWSKEGEKAQVDYIGPGRSGGYCAVLFVWDAQRQAWGRKHYAKWWDGLAALAWELSTRALKFEVTGPTAPAEPWSGVEGAEGTPPAGPPRRASAQ